MRCPQQIKAARAIVHITLQLTDVYRLLPCLARSSLIPRKQDHLPALDEVVLSDGAIADPVLLHVDHPVVRPVQVVRVAQAHVRMQELPEPGIAGETFHPQCPDIIAAVDMENQVIEKIESMEVVEAVFRLSSARGPADLGPCSATCECIAQVAKTNKG